MMQELRLAALALTILGLFATASFAEPLEPVLALAKKEKPAMIETMKQLVSIESGSGDREGLDRIASLVAERLKELGGAVELLEAGAGRYRVFDTPQRVRARGLPRLPRAG